MRIIERIIIFFIVFTMLNLGIGAQESDNSSGLYELKTTASYFNIPLMIARNDLICSYFIAKNVNEETKIIGAQEMDLDRVSYTDFDEMFINKGSNDGIKEGDMFSVLARGETISNPFTNKNLGNYYLRKSLAKVTCVYEKSSVITILNSCSPIELTDFLLPYKEEDILRKKKIDYHRCRLPQSPIEGTVVYTNIFMDVVTDNAGPENHITIDVGRAFVSRGDFILFYKKFEQSSLPPLIIGSGIVINAQNTNSTVRIIESSSPIEIGTKIVLVPDEKEAGDGQMPGSEDDIPLIDEFDQLEKTEEGKATEANILFELGETTFPSSYKAELEKIKEYIASKSKYVIILRGYSCSIGGLEYNLKLSQQRVENVKAALINELGVNKDFIETYYYGEKDAPYDNSTEEQRRRNRLVNIQVIGK